MREKNQYKIMLSILKKYKLLYTFKQSLKQCIYNYMNNCNNKAIPGTWSALIGKAIVENKEHLIDEVIELLKLHNMTYDRYQAILDILQYQPISYIQQHRCYYDNTTFSHLRDEIYKEINTNE